jgi:maltooligosyltrehalose trehalohydrolase
MATLLEGGSAGASPYQRGRAMSFEWQLGSQFLGEARTAFQVWAPFAKEVDLHLVFPEERTERLKRVEDGYHQAVLDGINPGARYFYRLDGGPDRPDPASKLQSHDVHSASEVLDSAFTWQDQSWFGTPLRDYILYELHVGTFTPEGTFEAIIEHLPDLKQLGVTALELMPVAQFPGTRNWGYDGVLPYAVQNSYGGPEGLKKLVNACHQAGLAVVLDVVYNHLGPEGNYLKEFGPYFTKKYHNAWGDALNFDGSDSDHVRRYFLENALYWQREFHVDALRLDAVHAIQDLSAIPFLQDLARASFRQSEKLNRRFYLIAESDLNDARILLPEQMGGLGLHAQWSDDFHHCLHVLLTGEQAGYYEDFGGLRQFAKVFREGFAYTGEHARHRKRRHGNSPRLAGVRQFIVYAQNHDQVGNRFQGERLSHLIGFEELKLAAGAVLLSPFIPMLFMGEEYGEPAPFQYMVSHADPELVEAVRRGRREEFSAFSWQGEAPDPFSQNVFEKSVLNRKLAFSEPRNKLLLRFYTELIRLRKSLAPIAESSRQTVDAQALETEHVLHVSYGDDGEKVYVIFCFNDQSVAVQLEMASGQWRKIFDSSDQTWNGAGSQVPDSLWSEGKAHLQLSPRSFLVLQKQP